MISRRELLQRLGATAAASLVAKAFPIQAAGEPPFQATAVNHISYYVRDYRRSRDFYASLLGMKVAYDDGKQCSLTFGSTPNAIYLRPARAGSKPYVDHLAYSVARFDRNQVKAELQKLRLNPRPDGEYAWTIRDPDGLLIQICAEKGVFPGAESPWAKESDGTRNLNSSKGLGGAFQAIAVAISYRVPNYAKSRSFYVDLLGMRATFDDGKRCNLAFGDDYLLLRDIDTPGRRSFVDSLMYAISHWNRDAVQAELARRGLKPRAESPYAWTISDPDGFDIRICDPKSVPVSFP